MMRLVGAAALAVAVGTSTATPTQQPGPPAQPQVSAAALADAVRVYDPSGSVTVYSTEGSVSVLETTETSGRATSVTLGSDVLFAFGKDTLAPGALPRLRELAAAVSAAGGTASVTGYTDSVGDAGANVALSRRRAQVVAKALSAAAPRLKLTVAGRGEADPVAPNTTGGKDDPLGRSKNRRVTTTYTSRG